MSRKQVTFSEESLAEQFDLDTETDESRLKKGKHSLDSDEDDDDNDKYDVMKEDDIEGQEDPTIDFDDDIQITPFNMRDEMEEGHFDRDGTFIFDKSKNIKDHWMDNIDWVRIKESERVRAQEAIRAREEAEAERPPADKAALYAQLADLLRPQETVAKALRRLGKAKGRPLSTAQRWKAKRQKTEGAEGSGSAGSEDDRQAMLKVTELADALVGEGDMEIYEASRERLSFLARRAQGSKAVVPDDADDDDALDMFADSFDQQLAAKVKDKAGGDAAPAQGDGSSVTEEAGGKEADDTDGGVRWEYRERDSDDAAVLGPFSTTQMAGWKDDGTFQKGVFCRRLGSGGQFYSSNRVDFDLYD